MSSQNKIAVVSMELKVIVSIQQYLNLLFSLTYSKPIMILLICFALILMLLISLYQLDLLNLPEPVIYQ